MGALSFSTAVVHHGDESLTERCLQSILDIDGEAEERLLIWNDPRTSPELIDRSLRSRFRIIETGTNLGFTGGANLAAANCQSDCLWLFNNDAVATPSAVGELLSVLERNETVGIVGPRILDDAEGRIWSDGADIEWPLSRPFSLGYRQWPQAPGEEFDTGYVCCCAPMIRLDALRQVGGFDDRFFIYFEDADLSWRLRAGGWRTLHVPAARVIHEGSATIGTGTPSSRYYPLRNRLLFSTLHAPDVESAGKERRRQQRRARRRALRLRWTGRVAEARALRDAIVDHDSGNYGKWAQTP